jgi:hypothetical protein
MIELANTSLAINAPINTVFNYISNMENYINWFPGVVDIRSANSLRHGVVGKEYIEKLSLPNGDVELTIMVVRSEVNKLFSTQGNLEGILPQMTVKFSVNTDKNCEVNLQFHSRNLTLTDNIINSLKEDLIARSKIALANLKMIVGQRH